MGENWQVCCQNNNVAALKHFKKYCEDLTESTLCPFKKYIGAIELKRAKCDFSSDFTAATMYERNWS